MVNGNARLLLEDLCSSCFPECTVKQEFLAGNFSPNIPSENYCSLARIFSLLGITSESMLDPYFRVYLLKQIKCIEIFKYERGICDRNKEESDEAWEIAYELWIKDTKEENLAKRFARIYRQHEGEHLSPRQLYNLLIGRIKKAA